MSILESHDVQKPDEEVETHMGHWQPALRPEGHSFSIPTPHADEATLPDFSHWKSDSPVIPPIAAHALRLQGPPDAEEPATGVDEHHNKSAAGLGKVSQPWDQETPYEASGSFNDWINYGRDVGDEKELEGALQPGGPIDLPSTNEKDLDRRDDRMPAVQVHEPSPLFGLSLPDRTKQGTKDDGAELSDDGDTERLDPAWGIKRMDSGQILAQVHRSPSFPDFASQREQTAPEHPTPLPVTQAEGVLQEVEEMTGGYQPFDRRASTESADSLQGYVREQDVNTSQFDTGAADTGDQHVNGESRRERRFEEGVPLMHNESEIPPIEDSQPQQATIENFFGQSEGGDDEFLFNRPTEALTRSYPPPLDRKGTVDVLQSLHFASGDLPDSPVGEGTQSPVDSAREHDFGIADNAFANGILEEKDDDISAMWKAALDDDGFLVEDPDELLPDSTPGSPSSFLDSIKADGVSLDDSENKAPQVASQSISREPAPNATETTSNFAPYQRSNPGYAPHQPSTSDLAQISPTTFGNMGISRPGISPMTSMQQQFQRPSMAPKAESFVDQSKGGYKSPYDLPMELAKPRKRTQMHQTLPPSQAMLPPPRSSSMTSDKPSGPSTSQLQSPFSPIETSFPPQASSTSSQVSPLHKRTPSATTAQTSSARPSSTTFFEELPMTARPRPPTGQGRYTPQRTGTTAPLPLLPQSPPSRSQAPPPGPPVPSQPPSDPYSQYQLQKPERLDPYANVPLQPPPAHVNVSTRYSPAPTATQAGVRPTPSPRYSPAPPPQQSNAPNTSRYASQPAATTQPQHSHSPPTARYASQSSSTAPPVTAAHPFQPRTSSPLAHFGRRAEQQQHGPQASSIDQYPASMQTSAQSQMQAQTNVAIQPSSEAAFLGSSILPPKRSQTQSPGKMNAVSRVPLPTQETMQRPASVHGQRSPVKASNPYGFVPPPRTSVRQRGLSQNLNFIPPTDGQELDELQRWKGSPIFRFGFGGSAVSSFPKHIPRYNAGSAMPVYKPTSGEVRVNSLKDILPLPEQVARFPGPLRSKSKKKEVLSWLSEKINSLEQSEVQYTSQAQLPDPRKRNDEKLLLWKILKVMVEHDGTLESNAEVRKAVNMVLSPEVHNLDDASATQYTAGNNLAGIYRPTGSSARPEPVDPVAVETLRKSLLRGDREKAAWTAVDNRLWAHALLISSTLEKTIWKQIVTEFVRKEVKMIGANTESLAALYEVFAGNLEESIDELVPPSARAGLQMVSKIDSAGPTKNALDGLDRWRETLSLVLNNRSENDQQALAALGGLLASYGRIEAAHLCYLFSRSPLRPTIFAGADDPNATIVLLGTDHRSHPLNFFQDQDAVLLTEIYEFATSVLPSTSTMAAMPHFQAFKLQRATVLAETGYNAESQAYCDAIAALSRSTTKMSSYFSPQFHAELDELSRRLKQAPVETSSWIAKPSIEKVSGTVWNKFTSFVAGDDSDAESKGSGKDPNYESGPFAHVTGTPSLSRSGSTTDLYGSYPGNTTQSVPNTTAGSRYAPGAQSAARSSSELLRARSSLDSQRSPPMVSSYPTQSQPYQDQASSFGSQTYMPLGPSPYQPLGYSPPSNRYQSTPPQTSYVPNSSVGDSPQMSYRPQQPESYVPTPPPEEPEHSYVAPPSQPATSHEAVPALGGYTPSPQPELQYQHMESMELAEQPHLQTQSYGYEPPADSGYVPYEPDPESGDESPPRAPKKKSFVDDDDDDFPRAPAAATTSTSASAIPPHDPAADAAAKKRANDLAADAAFRAAAEADAQRQKNNDKTVKPKASGWFGGWLGGKKEGSLDAKPSDQKVIRAKLGEESAFYYDQNLKKWVNKKDPISMQAGAKATPPPPKGPLAGPGRGFMPSASLPSLPTSPPMGTGPPSRSGTPGESTGTGPPMANGPPRTASDGPSAAAGPPSGVSTPPIGSGLAPPSRPGTGMSNASSIDDLLGPPSAAGRKTIRGKKGGKGGRYIDLMADKMQDKPP